jgi:hypothetical protein
MIKDHLTEMIHKKNLPGKLDPFALADIDAIAISSRHMFRSPYSYNEKSGLISIPIDEKEILSFNKEKAKIENVKTNIKFLDLENIKKGESSQLIIQAYDWHHKNIKKTELTEINDLTNRKEFKEPQNAIKQDYFPPCIIKGLTGLEDGKKRFLFILLNFLKNIGYDDDQIKNFVLEWNKKNKEPLRENYVISQLNWHKKQKSKVLPQNCPKDKEMIYSNADNLYIILNICKPDNLCNLVKNPVNYCIRKSRLITKLK